MENILLIIIIICIFILIFNNDNIKNNIEKFNTKYAANLFPGQSLMDLKNNIDIDYEFKKIEIPILNNEKHSANDTNNLDRKYGFLDEIFNNNKINYNPKNASEIYEKNK